MTEFGIIIAGALLLLLAAYWIGRASGARSRPEAKAHCPQTGTDVIGGCEWEPRYDLGASTLGSDVEIPSDEYLRRVAKQYRPKTYIHDICIKCGRTAERSRPTETFTASGTWKAPPMASGAASDLRVFSSVSGSGIGGSGGPAA